MKNVNFISALFISLLTVLISCQRELRFESHTAAGYLGKDVGGNCLPARAGGTFTAGINLDQTNYIEVEVEVNSAGAYSISTDTVNGYSFRASGNVSAAGSQLVRLLAIGKPVAAGLNQFEIRFDTSRCSTAVFVQSAAGPSAIYTLLGSPDKCVDAKIFGKLVKNIDLDTSNKVEITVDVTSPGNFSITTNTVNGHYFSRIGMFLTTGLQKVALMGTGKPIEAGETKFLIGGGLTSCNLSDTVYTN